MAEPRFLVLGPVEVATPRGRASPGGPTTRAVLCALLSSVGRAVPAERILYDVWGESAPGEHALQSHMSRLRKVIGTDRIVSVAGSYRLDAENDEIDARRFESLVAAARDDADPARVRQLCLEAFDLWRGVPFADLADRTFLRNEVERLEDLRLNAVELCVEADLALGRHRQIIGSLRAAVAEFPFHERMWGYLMSALDEAGRQPEALEAYDELARLLHDEFDIEPNKELQVLRRRLVES